MKRSTGRPSRPDGAALGFRKRRRPDYRVGFGDGARTPPFTRNRRSGVGDGLGFDGALDRHGGARRLIHFWDAESGKEQFALSGHTMQVESLSFAPNGRSLASAGQDGTVRIWDIERRRDASFRATIRPFRYIDSNGNLVARRPPAGGRGRRRNRSPLGRGRLEAAAAARWALGRGPGRGVFARRQDAGERRQRSYGAPVGCGNWSVAERSQRARRTGLVRDIFAGRQDVGLGEPRPHGEIMGSVLATGMASAFRSEGWP